MSDPMTTDTAQMFRQQRDEAMEWADKWKAYADRYREALEDIAHDEGTPGDPGWRRAMEALGLDVEAAERAWQD